jgi:transposase
MAVHIYPKQIRGRIYYYAQCSWREKIDRTDTGKAKGSGPSRVRSETTYLGSAESILARLSRTLDPLEVRHRDFGFVAAVYQTAVEMGLVELLKEHMPGQRYGIERWLYFLLPIINRLQHATSKQKMGQWAAKTVLPDLLDFDPKRLDSQSFWYATDDIISERKLRQRRKDDPTLDDDLFVGLDDATFVTIEKTLVANLQQQFAIDGPLLLYDTTNFFTYIEEPVRSRLARTGHNKDSHHHLRQVGLALCVDKEWGLPLFHRLYRGNSHDSKTFAAVVNDLIAAMKEGFAQVEDLVLVLDKGNNSQENFARLQEDQVRWVGSLAPTHYPDLMELPREAYERRCEHYRYYRCQRQVMGVECTLVVTYNEKLRRKQEHSLHNGIAKLEQQIREKWATYKRPPQTLPKGIISLIKESRYGDCILTACGDRAPVFTTNEITLTRRQKNFGKNLLFSSDLEAEAGWIITQYQAKDRIEDDFKLLKDPELIRWRPSRHWTDTKLRAFGFCCVMALLLIRVMELKVCRAGLRMSPAVLKEELADLREIIMVYDPKTAETKVSARSSIQQRLWDLFDLGSLETQLTGH